MSLMDAMKMVFHRSEFSRTKGSHSQGERKSSCAEQTGDIERVKHG